MIGNGVKALLKNPAQLKRLRNRPEWIKPAIEELLRFDTPLHLFKRWVLEDLHLNGVDLPFGGEVAVLLGAASVVQTIPGLALLALFYPLLLAA